MDNIKIIEEKINIEEILSGLSNPACGATACFIGTTRNTFNGKKVLQLRYEAYKPMAEKELWKICCDMRSKWPLMNVVIIHRIGLVPVCEASVLIAICSVHRKEALEAVSYGIDTVKAVVPIWKKEEYEDGTSSWKENSECKWAERKIVDV